MCPPYFYFPLLFPLPSICGRLCVSSFPLHCGHRTQPHPLLPLLSWQVCSKAKLMDATAYLLERSGDILGAFKLIREVENHPHSFSHSLTPSLPHLPTHPIPHSLTLSLPSSPPRHSVKSWRPSVKDTIVKTPPTLLIKVERRGSSSSLLPTSTHTHIPAHAYSLMHGLCT